MEKTHFPGYGRCKTCEGIIPDKEIHDHILNCRRKSSNEKIPCALCHKQIDIQDFQQHLQTCNEQQNRSSESNLLPKKQCPICDKFVEDLVSHSEICDNNTGYQTPRAETPTQIETNSSTERINSNIKETKLCVLCSQQIDQSDYQNHVTSCSNYDQHLDHYRYTNNDTSNDKTNLYRTKTHSEIDENPPQNSTISKIKQTKVCGLCSQSFNESEYRDHVTSCSNNETYSSDQSLKNTDTINHTKYSHSKRNNSSYSSQNHPNSSKKSTISKEKQTKVCAICSLSFDESEYRDHVTSCSNDHKYSSHQLSNNTDTKNSYNSKRNSSPYSSQNDLNLSKRSTISKKKQTKLCMLCSEEIDESEYADHVANCSNDDNKYSRTQSAIIFDSDKSNSSKISSRRKKQCGLCFQSFNEEEYVDHVEYCSSEQKSRNRYSTIDNTNQNKSKQKNLQKECIICFKSIDESEYMDHVTHCSSETSPSIRRDDYQTNQLTASTRFTNDNQKSSVAASGDTHVKTVRDCIICFKAIDLSQYENHVLACVAQTENQSTNSRTTNNLKCLTCDRLINKENDLYAEIACHSRHKHCLPCLRRSMDEFVRNRETPVCHRSLCDYELSRHDISSIPLERRLSDRLLKLVKGQQRPLCSKCHFYVDINENESFDEHFESCDDLIPCENCQFPFSFKELEIHTRQCMNDPTSINEKLINFVMKRTKYPFTKEQIRIFIQQKNKNHRNQLDPYSIVEALAVFGSIFPYEIPTRECGICMESRPYDDIYVFDCPDSHKLCYACYYQSCQAKINGGEILTCALCTHPLRDGELNQLRIPNDELKKIRDYQMKKTFDVYSSRTRGIIKCPNQNCTWVAEAADPNERFRVQCPQCLSEFCSLCNQQYHYRTSCQQLPQITQRWFFWCQTERGRYLRMRAEQDATYTNQLANYNRQAKENENRNLDLRRRYEELMNDEQYKAQNCRLCPLCKRVVQRLEGCDSMICGQDAHGGNLQSGCGAKFNWAQAQAYTAAAKAQPKQTLVDLPKPENPVVRHEGVRCDECQNYINGIRFDCVHCPSLTYCEKCEQQSTLIHSRENQALQQQQHVFKLIMVPEEEATQL